MEAQPASGLSLIVWQGWGVLAVIAVLTALLAMILAWLLPFPDRALGRQLETWEDRLAIKARLGEVPLAKAWFLALWRLNDWLDEWFGPPFSGQAFERNLAIAFIFPIVLFLLTLFTDGVLRGQIVLGEVLLFAGAFAVITYVIFAAFRNLLGLIDRLWRGFGGDAELAQVIAKVLLGALAVMIAFTIAFAIASTFSGEAASAGSVLGAMAGGFALAFAFAVAFALAGAALFAVVVAIVGGAALAFASEFAFLLFLFFIIIPVVNASMDWISWGVSRLIMARTRQLEPDSSGLAAMAGLSLLTFATGAVLMVALAAALPNAIELLNRAFAYAGLSVFDWQSLVYRAVRAPWTEGLFVTGMLLTTIVPASVYLIVGMTGVLARFVPGAQTAAASLSEHPDVPPSPAEQGPVKLTLILGRLWYLVAVGITIGLIALVSKLITVSHTPVAEFLSQVALCSTSWSHGTCGWF